MRLARSSLRPTLLFVCAWALLDAMLNVRYPGAEPSFWYLLPSVDVVLLFAYLAILAASDRTLPKGVRWALVVLFFLVRVLRLGDGVEQAYYSQPFHVYTDLPLAPELVRFALSTLPWWQFCGAALAALLLLAALLVALNRSLLQAETYLRSREHQLIALVFALSCFVATFVAKALARPRPEYRALFSAGFASSSLPRLRAELKFSFNIVSERAAFASTIAARQAALKRGPNDLKKLAGADVLLFVVESYGETVFRRPSFVAATRALYDEMERKLYERGFEVATGVLESSTYGGRSWLAQATLSTGVRTSNQLEYAVVCAKQPKAIAKFFEAAGYRSVLAQPGTTRPWPKGEFFGFDQRYYSWNFDYRGPAFGWATMPDQYVIDFVHRREIANANAPLFVELVLVSSHAPWSQQPRYVDDWSTLGNGEIYRELKPVRFPVTFPKFENGDAAYIRSIDYDMHVLERYLLDRVTGGALVIILGDHQPVAEVNGHSDARGVPVHVVSRNKALLQPFFARGYQRGMRPGPPKPAAGLESFLPNLLEDFSTRSSAR